MTEGEWAIVELFGHRRLAGYVTEAERFGTTMMRLDIPGDRPCQECEGEGHVERVTAPAGAPRVQQQECPMCFGSGARVEATQFYNGAAIYCLTPTTEEIARKAAVKPRPVEPWELEKPVRAAYDALTAADERDP